MIDAKCPQCGSENTQAIAIMMQTHTQSGAMQTGMVGYSQGGGLGVGVANSSIQLQNQLAAKYRMGPIPSDGTTLVVTGIAFVILGLLLAFPSFASKDGCFIFFCVAFLLLGILLFVGYSTGRESRLKARNAWMARRDYLQRAWVCHRCGHDWL